jgi:hypothetical protein
MEALVKDCESLLCLLSMGVCAHVCECMHMCICVSVCICVNICVLGVGEMRWRPF